MRTRTRQSIATKPYSIDRIWGSCSESSWTVYSTGTTNAFGEYQTMTDEVVPGYHQRSSRGEVFFNTMSSRHVIASEPQGSGMVMQLKTPINCSGTNRYQQLRYNFSVIPARLGSFTGLDAKGLPIAASAVSQNDLASLITEVSTSVQSQRGKSNQNLFESVAEINSSLALLPDMFHNARKLISRTASANPKVRSAASLYLLYRYGLRPIVSDISSVLENIDKASQRVRETCRASGTISSSSQESKSVVGNITEFYTLRKEEVVHVRAMALDEYIATAAFKSGFSTKGLLTLPWELVPYSFVVDWFVNVGDVIGSLVPPIGFTPLGACVTVHSERTTTLISTGYSSGPSWDVVSGPSGSAYVHEITKSRTPGLPRPGLVVRSDFRFDRPTRVLDALSLLIQKIRVPHL